MRLTVKLLLLSTDNHNFYYLRAQLFVQGHANCCPSHHDVILERGRLESHEQRARHQVDAVSLEGNAISEGLLPHCGDARLEDMVLELRHLEILTEDLSYGLFVSSLHFIEGGGAGWSRFSRWSKELISQQSPDMSRR